MKKYTEQRVAEIFTNASKFIEKIKTMLT